MTEGAAVPVRFQMVARTPHPDFLDLPWQLPLEEWESDRIVEVARGIHRHVVRFVNYDGTLYALKELPDRIAEREYRLLRRLADEEIPVVTVIGFVSDRSTGDGLPGTPPGANDEELSGVLITRHLEFSLPYRTLFTGHSIPRLRDRLLDALAELLVRLHLANFFWGDCSLSNTLFRRDAGELEAYLVDAETGEIHPTLSDRMRRYDIDIAEENVAGELMDVQAGYGLPDEIDPIETAGSLRRRYESLWLELTHEETFGPDERYRIDARLRRLNDLGFDVDEMELITTPDGYRLRMHTQVVEPGHHRRRLMSLTGLDVQENQARRLLYDIDSFRQAIERKEGKPLPESVVTFRWLREVFEPTIAAIPDELRGKLQPAEIYHQILEHRWFMSESEDKDVGLGRAVRSYINDVLRHVPDEEHVLTDDDDVMSEEAAELTRPTEPPTDLSDRLEPDHGS
jgi:hypothetical protein